MEAILEGAELHSPVPAPPKTNAAPETTQHFDRASAIDPSIWDAEEPIAAPKAEPPLRPAADATQLFDGASAIEPRAKEGEPPSPAAEEEIPYGFEDLALDDETPPASAPVTTPSPPAPLPPREPEASAMASFDDLVYAPEPSPPPVASDVTPPTTDEDVPIVEASIVEVVDGEDPGLPVLDPEAVVEATPPLGGPVGGMEALAGSDPFTSDGGFSFDAVAFESEDPVAPQGAREKKSEPPAPPPEDADLDLDGLDHLFNTD